MLNDDRLDPVRYVGDRWNEVGAQMWGQHLPIPGDQVLAGSPAQRLHDCPLDLSLHLLGIDRLAHVVGAENTQDPHLPCLCVHLHLHGLGDVAVGKVGQTVAGLGVEGGGLGSEVGVFSDGRPLFPPPAFEGLLRCTADRVADHKSHPRGGDRASTAGAGACVRSDDAHRFQWQRERLGRHLAADGVSTLPHFGVPYVDHGLLDLCFPPQLDFGPAVLLIAEGETDVLEGDSEADAGRPVLGAGDRIRNTRGRMGGGGGNRSLPAVRAKRPTCGQRTSLGDLHQADAARQGCAHTGQAVVTEQVLETQLDRVHLQCLGQLVHLHLGGENPLRRAKAPKGAAGHVVGVHTICVHLHIRNLVRTGTGYGGVPEHLVGGIAVRAAISDDAHLRCDELARAGRPPLAADPRRVALAVTDDRLLATPDGLDRAF